MVRDSVVYLSRLDRQVERFGFDVAAVGLDAGYATAGIAKGLEERQVHGVTGHRRPIPPKPGMMAPSAFTFAPEADGYRCPQGQLLAYATTDRSGYRHYRSDPAICRTCPLLASCTSNAKAQRTIHPPRLGRCQAAHRRQPDNRMGQGHIPPPKGTVERSFADAKQLFGHRYKSGARARPVPARRRCPEHQEDRNQPVAEAETRLRMTLRELLDAPDNLSCQKIPNPNNATNANPAQKDGVCQV